MSFIFLSYSSKNRAEAELICKHIEAAGMQCWMAPRDVLAGQEYDTALMDAISECGVFLLVFSKDSSISRHVRKEVEFAGKKETTILPCLIDQTNPDDTKFSYHLGTQHRFDASSGQIEDHLPRLIEHIKRLIAVTPRQRAHGGAPSPIVKTGIQNDRKETKTRPVIGIDVGATKIRGCVIHVERLDVHSPSDSEFVVEVKRPATASSVLAQVKAIISRLVTEKLKGHPPAGIGIAAPGQVDIRAGVLKFAPGLGLRSVPFRAHLAGTYPGVSIRVDNDVRCATRCELHIGVGKEFDDFICLFVGTGVGSGIVINKIIHVGHNYSAGEIGHIKIDSNGPPCLCGQIGCLETFVKGPAILERARAKAIAWESRGLKTLLHTQDGKLDTKKIVDALDKGDDAALEVIEEVATKLGVGIANYLNLINPAAVVLGGGIMSGFFLHMIDGITRSMQKNALAEVANTPLVQSQHMDDGAAIGAALLFHPDEEWS